MQHVITIKSFEFEFEFEFERERKREREGENHQPSHIKNVYTR